MDDETLSYGQPVPVGTYFGAWRVAMGCRYDFERTGAFGMEGNYLLLYLHALLRDDLIAFSTSRL